MPAAAVEGVAGMVSVIVPTHNRARLLRQALASILAQRYPLIDIIVIANGCRDETAHVVRDMQATGHKAVAVGHAAGHTPPVPQVTWTFLEFEETLGGARARNIGLDAARGDYVAFLDDDDLWHPDKLMTQVQLLNQYRCAIVGTQYFYLYGDNQYRPAGGPVCATGGSTELSIKDLSCENSLGGFSLCVTRKSCIGHSRIHEGLDALQDWDLWLKILRNTGLPARISPSRHVYYRLGSERLSGRYTRVAGAQKLFLQSWHMVLDEPSINYHHMRTWCVQLKRQTGKNVLRCIIHSGWIVKTIFHSRERGNIKRYIHYLLLPILDIDAVRVWIWKRRVWKHSAWH